MRVPEKYKVQSIKTEECREWLLYKHYAKRIPPISFSFGLFNDKILIGVCTYGTPVSNNLRNLWKGKFKVIELNRLCVNEGLDKNTLSFFVSGSLRKLDRPMVIISYADTSQNHHGYIYQATNFIYTGLSAKRTDWKIKGMEHLHGATIADLSRGKKDRADYMRKKYGDKFYLKDRPRKHRYFYFIGNRNEKMEMLEMLPYEIEPYPKGDNIRYDADYEPTIQAILF